MVGNMNIWKETSGDGCKFTRFLYVRTWIQKDVRYISYQKKVIVVMRTSKTVGTCSTALLNWDHTMWI